MAFGSKPCDFCIFLRTRFFLLVDVVVCWNFANWQISCFQMCFDCLNVCNASETLLGYVLFRFISSPVSMHWNMRLEFSVILFLSLLLNVFHFLRHIFDLLLTIHPYYTQGKCNLLLAYYTVFDLFIVMVSQ